MDEVFRIAQCKQQWLVKSWLNFDLNLIFISFGRLLLDSWKNDQNSPAEW